jgi:hypothetical protein
VAVIALTVARWLGLSAREAVDGWTPAAAATSRSVTGAKRVTCAGVADRAVGAVDMEEAGFGRRGAVRRLSLVTERYKHAFPLAIDFGNVSRPPLISPAVPSLISRRRA